MELHPFCKIFPPIEGNDLDELVESIRTNGLREKIITHEGKVLDGQNRLAACEVAGEKPKFEKFKGKTADALAYVVDKNFNRRHLTASQRSMIAAEIATAKNSETTAAEAAKKLGVSRDSTQVAKKILKKSKKLAKQVKNGKVSLKKAEEKIAPKKKAIDTGSRDYSNAYSSSPKSTKTEEPKDKRSIGQICFDGFSKAMKVDDANWEGLPENEKAAWKAGAEAAIRTKT